MDREPIVLEICPGNYFMNFIESYKRHLSHEKCDSIVNFFNENFHLSHKDDYRNYRVIGIKPTDNKPLSDDLWSGIEKYIKKYPYLKNMKDSWSLEDGINIQMYDPGKGYTGEHHEHTSFDQDSRRHLALMVYLNDIKKGGHTNWPHQRVKIKPEKGTMVIWPASWTHSHHGVLAPKETKYIITGWCKLD
jgi:hypothetical protein